MSNQKLKVIFMGTPDWALPSLQSLIDHPDFEVITVVTQEDKKVGRDQKISPMPVKVLAEKHHLPILQPQKIHKNTLFINLLKKLEPDFIVVVAYAHLLPQEVLDIPKYGCINIHPSLLPKYRGASPIQSALLHGDLETGVSIMKMGKQMDNGPIFYVKKLPIDPKDNADTLGLKLFILAGMVLPEVLGEIAEGTLHAIPQNEAQATFCTKISKEDGIIDLKKLTAEEILNRIRAYTPWPSCFIILKDKRIKILEAEIDMGKNLEPGSILYLDKNSVGIGTKKGILIPKKIQLEGKKPLPIEEFLRGNKDLLTKLLASAT